MKFCSPASIVTIILATYYVALLSYTVYKAGDSNLNSFVFVVTPSQPNVSSSPTLSPTTTNPPETISPTPPPPLPPFSVFPPTVSPNGEDPNKCVRCSPMNQPNYSNFPHPHHTNESFAVFNFFNHNAIDGNGANMTVWITMVATADSRMAAYSSSYIVGYSYVFIDALPLKRGESAVFTMPRSMTANGHLGGGRILIYYRHPREHDLLRQKYGSFPVQKISRPPIRITQTMVDDGPPGTPSDSYAQLLEFTMDIEITNVNVHSETFIDYDLSAVDKLSMPVYIFGGSDPRTKPGATSGNSNNGFPCGKAYIACKTAKATTYGCPTMLQDITANGSVCLASYPYCQRQDLFDDPKWKEYCHRFDDIANKFGFNQTLLTFYKKCVESNIVERETLHCPSIVPPLVITPTAVIYGCVGQFLLENHCLNDGSRFTKSHMDGTQCSALNRGLCVTPDYNHIPLPSGLSCLKYIREEKQPIPCKDCPGCVQCLGNVNITYPVLCYSYDCFGNGCKDIDPSLPIGLPCFEHFDTLSKSKVSTCNDSSPDPYLQNLLQNDYAAWARFKGERFYSFSLDEEEGGGNQQCLYSTQLDVVVFPSCGGNLPDNKLPDYYLP